MTNKSWHVIKLKQPNKQPKLNNFLEMTIRQNLKLTWNIPEVFVLFIHSKIFKYETQMTIYDTFIDIYFVLIISQY